MNEANERRRAGIRGCAWGLGLLVLAVYLGFMAMAVISLPGAVAN